MTKNTDDSSSRLMTGFTLMGSHDLTDELYAFAYNIEQTLINAGAVPRKDYGYLDLVKLAQPFVLDLYQRGEISYTYPADEVASPPSRAR